MSHRVLLVIGLASSLAGCQSAVERACQQVRAGDLLAPVQRQMAAAGARYTPPAPSAKRWHSWRLGDTCGCQISVSRLRRPGARGAQGAGLGEEVARL